MTVDQAQAFVTMRTTVRDALDCSHEIKRNLVCELLARKPMYRPILCETATVYVGSRTDVHLPLLMGGRKIHLVDPYFNDPATIVAMQEMLARDLGKKVTRTGAVLQFGFDFGAGEERATVECKPCVYGVSPLNESVPSPWKRRFLKLLEIQYAGSYEPHTGVAQYVPTEDIGLLIGFNCVNACFDQNRAVMDRLVVGGHLFQLRSPCEELDLDWVQYRGTRTISRDAWTTLMEDDYDAYTRYSFIPLRSMPADVYYSFIRRDR